MKTLEPQRILRSRREIQVGPSEACIQIQDRLIPWVNWRTCISFSSVLFLLRVLLSVISVLLTFKIFEACADFLTPDGLGSYRKRRNFGAHRSLVQSCGCGLAALGSPWLEAFVFQ